MAWNFYTSCLYLITLKILCSLATLYVHVTCGGTQLPDVTSRILTNEFYLNLYYFFWTSFWYLPTFFITILFIYKTFNMVLRKTYPQIIITPLLLLMVVECIDYSVLNSGLHQKNLIPEDFNILLLNSINKYHPLLLYCVLLIIFSNTYIFRAHFRLQVTSRNVCRYLEPLLVTTVHKTSYFSTSLIFYTLFLGSWWAVQEGSWGGWWNWDPSEVFGLVLALNIVRWYHSRGIFWTNSSNGSLLLNYTLSIVALYTFIQINFDLVSHNFGTRIDQFVEPVYLLLLVFMTINTILLLEYSSKLARFNRYYLITPRKLQWGVAGKFVFNQLLSICFILLAYASFVVLLNDFIWKSFSINVGNSLHKHIILLVPLMLTTLLMGWQPSRNLPITVLYSIFYKFEPLLLILLPLKQDFRRIKVLHLLLLLFITINILHYFKANNLWQLLGETGLYFSDDSKLLLTSNTLNLNSSFIEISTRGLFNNQSVDGFWNLIYLDTSPESRMFLHCVTSDSAKQFLLVGNRIFTFMVTSYDSSLLPITYTFLASLSLLYFVYARRLSIVF